MVSERMAEVLRLLRRDDWPDHSQRGAVALGVDGISASVALDAGPAELLWCSADASRRFEDLQFTLGEGPAVEAARTGHAVLEADLRQVRPERWPLLLPEAERLPVQAVFCFPLGIGAIHLGVLTAVRAAPAPLGRQQTDDALALAAALTAQYLGGDEPPGVFYRAVVHQAVGMVSVQLSLPLADSMLRLRAFSYRSGRPINDVSRDVVARRLRLDANGNGSHTNAVEKD